MEFYLFKHGLADFWRVRRIWAWFAIIAVVTLLGSFWRFIATDESPLQRYSDLSSIFVFHLVALAAAIMTTSIVGQEVEQRTIVYILTRPISRWKLLLMRFLASSVTVSILGILTLIALSLVIFGNPAQNSLLTGDILAVIFGSFAYSAFCLLVSLLIVRSMIVCILFILVWETSVPNMQGDLYRISIFSYMQGIAQHPQVDTQRGIALFSGSLGTNLLTPGDSYPVLIGLIVVLTVVSLVWFSKFEYVPREDAE